ncbi:MAG TPA: hypothetical protein VNT60_04675 [Deinococcales bacterium]|nr:hypothetical protein [Deinococcales bacterium]
MQPSAGESRHSFDATHYQREPARELTPEKEAAFAALAERARAAGGGVLDYDLPYPKHEFFWWLTECEGLLLHGTSNGGIDVFEPRAQGDAFDRPVTAVFASSDPVWPTWFATIDWRVVRLTSNDCLVTRAGRLYRFAVDRAAFEQGAFSDGWIYLLERDGFARTLTPNGRETEEWTCPQPVRPLARLALTPDDFPFLSAAGPVDYHGTPTREWAAFKRVALAATSVDELDGGFRFRLPPGGEGAGMARELAAALAEHNPFPGLEASVDETVPAVTLGGPPHAREAVRALSLGLRPSGRE